MGYKAKRFPNFSLLSNNFNSKDKDDDQVILKNNIVCDSNEININNNNNNIREANKCRFYEFLLANPKFNIPRKKSNFLILDKNNRKITSPYIVCLRRINM